MHTTEFVCYAQNPLSYFLTPAPPQNSFYGYYFPVKLRLFLEKYTHHLDFKRHGRERASLVRSFFWDRDGLNNDAVNFSKHFSPKYVIQMSQMKRVMTGEVKAKRICDEENKADS